MEKRESDLFEIIKIFSGRRSTVQNWKSVLECNCEFLITTIPFRNFYENTSQSHTLGTCKLPCPFLLVCSF